MVGTSVRERLRQGAEALLARSAQEIDLDLLEPDPQQPRKTRDPVQAAELAESVRAQGVLSPLLVTQLPDTGRYRIIFGERRYHAARDAGLRKVPCVVRERLDPLQILVIQLTENLQREDPRPLEVAASLARLESDFGLKRSEIARILGRHPSWVTNTLALLATNGPAREALEEGLLSDPETTRLFEKLPDHEKDALLSAARTAAVPIRRGAVHARLASASTPQVSPEVPSGQAGTASLEGEESSAAPAEWTGDSSTEDAPLSSAPHNDAPPAPPAPPARRGRPARPRRPDFVLPSLTWEELLRLFELLDLNPPSDPSSLEEAFARLRAALKP